MDRVAGGNRRSGRGGYWLYRHFRQAGADSTAGLAGKGDKSGGRPIPVVAARARLGNMDIYLTGLGSVQPLNTVTVRTRIDGEINGIYFVEGQLIHKGEVLFQIDPRPYEVVLTQAQAQMAKDQSVLANAKVDLERDIEAESAIPKQQLDTQRALVTQTEAAIKIDQGQIDAAQLNLTYTRITSPLTGRIGLKVIDQGNMVHASDSSGLVVITQTQPISVIFNLPEDTLPQVLKQSRQRLPVPFGYLVPKGVRKIIGTPVLRVEAYNRDLTQKIASGTLLAVDSQIDPTTGTVRLKALFPNPGEALFPNQFVNARLLVDTLRDAVIVPTAAIQRSPQTPQNPNGTFVYVVKPDKTVEMRTVTLGPSEGDDTVIETGLSASKTPRHRPGEPGAGMAPPAAPAGGADKPPRPQEMLAGDSEIVVVDGVDKLQNGSKVTPRFGNRPTSGPANGPTSGPASASAGGAGAGPMPQSGGDASKHAHGDGSSRGAGGARPESSRGAQ